MAVFAVAIFIGAFLLFQVQPLMGKYLLPWFGGGPGVWTCCLLFFQTGLVAGYAYAHWTSRWLNARAQALVHAGLVIAALACLPIVPTEPRDNTVAQPALQVMLLLGSTIGLQYFVLAASGPLLQRWLVQLYPARQPYRLYALSNVGSLLALLSYPFLVETHFTRKMQACAWSWGLGIYGAAIAVCVILLWRRAQPASKAVLAPLPDADRAEPTSSAPGISHKILWLLLPACASLLLVSVTNKICQDVAVIPFLWVAPLSLYLLSFVLCFDSSRWYSRFLLTLPLAASLAAMTWGLWRGSSLPVWGQVCLYGGSLFVCCMVCHGELYRLRPGSAQLTGYYLAIAVGGAGGGLFAGLAAPLLFRDFYELHWGILLCAFLFLWVCATDTQERVERKGLLDDPYYWRWLACLLPFGVAFALDRGFAAVSAGTSDSLAKTGLTVARYGLWALFAILAASWVRGKKLKDFKGWRWIALLWLGFGFAGLAVALYLQAHSSGPELVYRSRSFYGVLSVFEHSPRDPERHHFLLQHGRITHGLQFADEQTRRPTTYYGEESGIGLAIAALPAGPRRLGLVGLGTGTIASYGRRGDYLRIYEINPEVRRLALSWFSFLSETEAAVDVVLGDARLSMEKEFPQMFDVLALDAFSSDAIPVHLLTREAFELYGRHLAPEGILAVHISNHYLDLQPVVQAAAAHFGYDAVLIDDRENSEKWWLYSSTWMLLSRDPKILHSPQMAKFLTPMDGNHPRVPLWTDDFASLFRILK